MPWGCALQPWAHRATIALSLARRSIRERPWRAVAAVLVLVMGVAVWAVAERALAIGRVRLAALGRGQWELARGAAPHVVHS